MNKKTEINKAVKRKIADALLALMREKSIADVTVTELVNAAGVARVTFYRNYSSKENVLTTLIDDALEELMDGRDYHEMDYMTYRHVLAAFEMFKKRQSDVSDLYHSGFAILLLERLNDFHAAIAGGMPNSSADKYAVYFYMGAMFDIAVNWIENGCVEPTKSIAEVFCKQLGIDVPENRIPEAEEPTQSNA